MTGVREVWSSRRYESLLSSCQDTIQPVTYTTLGDELNPVAPDDTEIFYNTGRIRKIENLGQCRHLKVTFSHLLDLSHFRV